MCKKLILFFILLLASQFNYAEQKAVFIPAGEFTMGCSPDDSLCDADEGSRGGEKVFVDSFWIDRHETSVAEYRACVLAGYCDKPFDNQRNHYCNYNAQGRDDYPLNCVNWLKAKSYCEWRGGRLAYEAEWEKAARAGTSTAYYWGNQPASCKDAVMDPGKPGQSDEETDGCWRDLTWPRGSHRPNPYGLYDMIGGTSEWVMNWYQADAYKEVYAKGDIKGPQTGKTKAIKGGSWDEKHWAQRVTNRYDKPVTGNPDLYGSNGIRCVWPVKASSK